jgi:hypothetical protein
MSARSFRIALMFAVVSTAPLAAQEPPEPLPITLPAGASGSPLFDRTAWVLAGIRPPQ